MKSYDLILADPPWPETGGGGRGAQNHYSVARYGDIPRMVLGAPCFKPAPAFWFGVWATVSSLPAALDLLAAGGARYVTAWTWVKTTAQGSLAMGMGQYGRHAAEFIVWGKQGTIGRKPGASRVRAVFEAQATEHSAKPAEAYEAARAVFDASKRLAMFERKARAGFDVWGDEAPGGGQ